VKNFDRAINAASIAGAFRSMAGALVSSGAKKDAVMMGVILFVSEASGGDIEGFIQGLRDCDAAAKTKVKQQ
jgi:hypothetical protein